MYNNYLNTYIDMRIFMDAGMHRTPACGMLYFLLGRCPWLATAELRETPSKTCPWLM